MNSSQSESSDIKFTLNVLKENRAEWLIIDGKHFQIPFQLGVKTAGYRLLIIDDTAKLSKYHCHILLNQNIHAGLLEYNRCSDTALLLGTQYALLRKEFVSFKRRPRFYPKYAFSILITIGGGDVHNATLRVVKAIETIYRPEMKIRILIGPTNPHTKILQEFALNSKLNIQILQSVKNVPELMDWADLAISAAGSTCWELAFMGLPSVLLVTADDQKNVAEGLHRVGASINLGWEDSIPTSQFVNVLSSLIYSPAKREEMGRVGKSLVSGCGAKNVVQRIMTYNSFKYGEITVRPVVFNDLIPIWELANHPSVRSRSFSRKFISLEDHRKWLSAKLLSTETRSWVIEVGGIFAGMIRYDKKKQACAELSYSVVPWLRNRGVGEKLLVSTRMIACRELAVNRLFGRVIKTNHSSIKVFEKAGYKKGEEISLENGRTFFTFEWCSV